MSKQFFGDLTADVSPREAHNRALAREAAREGFVLLKNDGALPLQAQKIALYGMGARKTVKGGTGSGIVNERHSVTFEQGLEAAGYEITTKAYLDAFDVQFHHAYSAWRAGIEEAAKGQPLHRAIAISVETPFRYPEAQAISEADIANSATDTAIYVLARQAGEGKDRRLEPSDYLLTASERTDLSTLAAAYRQLIVIINIGGFIDLSWLDEVGVDALIFCGQGGMEGGHALADLLSGQHTFSGKLVDTWATRYEDYPSAMSYSYLNGDLDNENYAEGIFVGYRYFERFNIRPRFPFGFGLSYTTFATSVVAVSVDLTEVVVTVTVQNTGDTYSGKEVIQCYLACPDGTLEKEVQRLVTFAKTETLAVGAEQTLELRFSMEAAASYVEAQAAWVMEAGEYVLHIGNSSQNTAVAAVIVLDRPIITEQCKPCCVLQAPLDAFPLPPKTAKTDTADVPCLVLNSADFATKCNDYAEPEVIETARETALLERLSLAESAELLRGGGVQGVGSHTVVAAAGKTTISLIEQGIGNIVLADGPAGLNIVNQLLVSDTGEHLPIEIPDKYKWGGLGDYHAQKVAAAQGTHVWRYATAWPVHMVLAQSWNVALVEQVGHAIGAEMTAFGITVWLGPALNIHRNPLCGRTFEYFSEDPLISGVMSAAMTNGVQGWEGLVATLKHFAVNNQEDNRIHVSSNVSERALREIYLKGFEIAVKQSRPKALMSSYNKVNGVYAPNNHDLLTDILRCEWGFDGMVMTDWGSCAPGQGDPTLCAPAGNDLVMPGTAEDQAAILTAVENGTIDQTTLRRSACRVLRLVLESGIYAEQAV